MNLDKALGPIGFLAHFYQKCWGIIKNDLIRMIQFVQRINKIGGSTNSTFLALIPKETNPSSFTRFIPISLCNVSYKIISKIIANRLKPFLPSLISPNQGRFVEKRKMVDNIILVQEAIHSSQLRGDKGMAIKIDMANAFDQVRHRFLLAVLTRFDFNEQFISWVSACIHCPWMAPLVNGRPTPFFKVSRGLRWGCPLSSIFYILMDEALNKRLDIERRNKTIPGIKIAQGVKRHNNSQFAEDTILLGGPSSIIARRFKWIMDDYTTTSGGLVNEAKSQIYAWNTNLKDG
jgi:hypothetical protein